MTTFQEKRCINALKNIQLKIFDIESKFNQDLHELELKYASLYEPLYEQREKIVNGKHIPTDEEAKWEYKDPSDIFGLNNIMPQKDQKANGSNEKSGLENFWLETFKSTNLLLDMIQEHDEPVLKHLTDLKLKLNKEKPYGFTLEFHFSENEYFTNKVLTKTYEMVTEKDKENPFSYEGGMVCKSKGCKIDWKEGKNLTVQVIKKKQTSKSDKSVKRVVTKEEKQESFFSYFDEIKPGTDENDNDEDDDVIGSLLEMDFQVGQFIKENIIPKASLYFSGDLNEVDEFNHLDDEDDEGDDDDDDDDDDVEDDDDEEEETKNPRKKNRN
jgi:hypothetical protein